MRYRYFKKVYIWSENDPGVDSDPLTFQIRRPDVTVAWRGQIIQRYTHMRLFNGTDTKLHEKNIACVLCISSEFYFESSQII